MTDVLDQVAAHNPVRDADLRNEGLTLSFEDLWRDLDHPRPPEHARPLRLRRPAIVGGAATAVAATTLAIVLLSAGGAPSAAQAFPILTTKAVDLRTHDIVAARGIVGSALSSAHAFSESYGTGYVIESPDGNTLYLLLPPAPSSPSRTWLWASGSTPSLEQKGGIFVFDGVYLALVPTGGSLTVAVDGATTSVPVDGGLASGVVSQSETLTLQVGGFTTTAQVAPNSPGGGWLPTGSTSATGTTSTN